MGVWRYIIQPLYHWMKKEARMLLSSRPLEQEMGSARLPKAPKPNKKAPTV